MEFRKNPATARGICLFSGGKRRVVLRFCNDLYLKNCGTILIEALLDQTSLKHASLSATPYKIFSYTSSLLIFSPFNCSSCIFCQSVTFASMV